MRGFYGPIDAKDGDDVICIEDGLTTVPRVRRSVLEWGGRGADVVENHSDSGSPTWT